MTTIPASQIVRVIPNVLPAGGDGLQLSGMFLTNNTRVPAGQVLGFPNDGVSVASFFGPGSQEAALANNYFLGFDISTKKPAILYFVQYNVTAVAAYLQGGKASSLTLAQLQGINGTLTVSIDGYPRTAGSLNLSAATSFSSAAALIQTALIASEPTECTFTGAIAPLTSAFTGSIAGNVLTVTAVASGVLVPGTLVAGTGVTASTNITSQLTGAAGGIGTYSVDVAQILASSSLTGAYGSMTVSAVASGTLSVGQTISGGTAGAGTLIWGLGTGTGLLGTYFVQLSQTVASAALTAKATDIAVTYDSTSGSFFITSGIVGPSSGAAYATGTTAASLFLTQATGAQLSQGAAAQTPSGFMTNLTQITQNWATFMTLFDPDGGSGNAQKLLFAQWTNAQNDRWAYICWDTDITPTQSLDAASSLGQLLAAAGDTGTALVYSPSQGPTIAAFICGVGASINFTALNGRITFAFRSQAGITADVTTATVAQNLIANGYNFYGVYATAADTFIWLYPGSVSGEFEWLDSYVNQIWFNNACQLALMELLKETNSIPFNAQGYELIASALSDPINNALFFGAIRKGVILSALQAAEINTAAGGVKASDAVQAQGWYLQIVPAQPQVRQARQSPGVFLWYTDGESVQQIDLSSTLVQ